MQMFTKTVYVRMDAHLVPITNTNSWYGQALIDDVHHETTNMWCLLVFSCSWIYSKISCYMKHSISKKEL